MTYLKNLLINLGIIDYEDRYTIQKNPTNGKWTIYDQDGCSIAGYSRRRDAFRGAERAGYTIV